MKHVDLYVNEWTTDLGDIGKNALRELSERARSIGLVTPSDSSIEIFA
jgi:1,4-dihydroxy-6-naphthoate synthase